MFGVGDFWLKTRSPGKLRPILAIIETLTDFHWDEAKTNIFLVEEKISKWPIQKKLFQNHQTVVFC